MRDLAQSTTFMDSRRWRELVILQRLRSDLQLSILTFFAAVAIVGILPLAVYQFVGGQPITAAAIANCLVLLCICGTAAYAWQTGDTRRAGLFLVIFITVLGVVMARMQGQNALFSMFVIMSVSFLLTDRKNAAVIAALALIVLAVDGKAFGTPEDMFLFTLNAVLVSVCAFIFAARAEAHSRQFEALATIDVLTGCYNRRAMDQELAMAVAMQKRNRSTFGLVILDIDYFKRINDRYGHRAGDQLLVTFAGLLKHSIRRVDRVFRLGGDEFLVLLPGANIAALQTITANLQSRFATELRGPGGPVTCSHGAAMLMADEHEHSWMARADAALYRAKQNGRNRAVVDRAEARAARIPDTQPPLELG